jgi:hypothetical protein
MYLIPNCTEFGISFVDTLSCVDGQLKFKNSAPLREEFHKFEEFCIPAWSLQYLCGKLLLHVGIARIRAQLDVICRAINEQSQAILKASAIGRDVLDILHVFEAASY